MRIPGSTYRFQFNSGFTFKDALGLVGYLSDLGITDLYASPIFCARKGSIHGYDMIDPLCINPEIGSEEEFERLTESLREKDIGWVQDIVPNHMAYDSQNRMLADVFQNGVFSEYYNFFDIDWNHAYESMKGRLLAPFLGKSYGESLESGEIRISYDEEGFFANYYSIHYPVRMESYVDILSPNLNTLKEHLGPDHPDYIKLIGIIFTLRGFPCQELSEDRPDQIRFIKGMLWELYRESAHIREFLDRNLGILNGETGSNDFSLIDQLLYRQFFRLSYWKVASEEINYRRFFSINELISLRMEDPEVFAHFHEKVFKLVSRGSFTGLRVDHIDGLFDPLAYLKRLRDETEGVYSVVEKILSLEEELPSSWPVQGTTGYDYLNFLNGIFCQKENEAEFNRVYASFADVRFEREDLLYEEKSIIIEHFMTGDVDNLAHLMKRISSKDRGGGDITLHGLRRAIFEVLALFPVYRTYISRDSFTGSDRKYISEAVERARKRRPHLVNEINYLAKFLLLKYEDYLSEEEKENWLRFVMRFQQFSGPLMAKGFEDTLLYVFNRLVSLNEVGGNPFVFGITADEFHKYNQSRWENWPHAMSATSTHDTKRGEDVRARINVISELPLEWEQKLKTWSGLNEKHKARVNNIDVPAPNDEYQLYQTLIGAWPFEDEDGHEEFVRRIKDYVIKATREAKIYTGWIKPYTEYEEAFEAFVGKILEKSPQNEFMKDFLPFQEKLSHFGMINSLSQVLLKVCSPGIPDFYQGSELWDLNLVDPDNRRQVDYRKRVSMLEAITRDRDNPEFIPDLLSSARDGRIKLFLTLICLEARRSHRNLFRNGSYIPLKAGGDLAGHVLAFARREENAWCVVVTPRFITGLAGVNEYPLGEQFWKETWLELPDDAPYSFLNHITNDTISVKGRLFVARALAKFPLALIFSA